MSITKPCGRLAGGLPPSNECKCSQCINQLNMMTNYQRRIDKMSGLSPFIDHDTNADNG